MKPLVIPLKENTRTSRSLAVLQNIRDTIEGVEDETAAATTAPDAATSSAPTGQQPQSLEDRAALELIAAAQGLNNTSEDAAKTFVVPMNADQLVLDGAAESTVDDYENVPVSAFGMAMLRGMGLSDSEIRNAKGKEPELRPKGMGLGADKVARPQKLMVAPAANEVLEIKKNAFVKILAGKHKDLYAQVSSEFLFWISIKKID